MKKIIMLLACLASIVAVASTEVYDFSTTLKYPEIGKTAFVGASSRVKGTLTVTKDGDNISSSLKITFKKTGATYTLVPEENADLAVFGKKGTDCATTVTFINEYPTEGLVSLTFTGWGRLKTKTTGGCTPCGDTTETCSRVTKLQGVVSGLYICPCGGSFQEWDGNCYIDPDMEIEAMPVYGSSAKFTLKTVDGKKWK